MLSVFSQHKFRTVTFLLKYEQRNESEQLPCNKNQKSLHSCCHQAIDNLLGCFFVLKSFC